MIVSGLTNPMGKCLGIIRILVFLIFPIFVTTEATCIFCDHPAGDDAVVIEENGFEGKQCADCGLVYTSPRPSPDEVFDLYGHDEAGIPAQNHIRAAYVKRLYANHYLDLIGPHISSGNLLEVGAGAGFFLDEARRRGFTPHALEFNPDQAEFMRKQMDIPCEQAALSDKTFADVDFDLVYHCDVISHFFDPVEEMKRTADRTRDGGWLVFETGNLGDVDHRHYKWFSRFQYPDHLFFFSTENIENMLDDAGYELVNIHRYSILPQLKFIKWTMGLRNGLNRMPARTTSVPVRETAPAPVPDLGGGLIALHANTQGEKVPRRRPSTPSLKSKLAAWMHYGLRYKVGASVVKDDEPQTMLVIARKVGDDVGLAS